MNDILYGLGWVLKGIELLIVLFWLHKFSTMRWKLFFGQKKDLSSVHHHELYSCFLAAFSVLVFHLIGSEVDQFTLSLTMDKVDQIKLFYTCGIIVQFSFAMILVCLHLVRGCTFSPTARICMYTTLVYISLLGMQLIARGYYDYHALSSMYRMGGWMCNLMVVTALCTYPIRCLKGYFREKYAMA
ncbi:MULTISPECIES: hypothetical protein [Pseudoalteromonas]|uniref:Uncharacterized protein n=1 Tax=Pseudoalteromonas amylolytica TaxID=1859457 RepID=A0A1S1MK06_9GAMM|nr:MULTISPECIES: hypothetical protein [Pseudoalteromonas]MCF6437492.1 hypothetical protein [Pseudoalteromonas sp. MMG022]OHU85793.1 hypothetical protein BFC16_18000 [Pseudoalteromonas sp. JW3]OHU87305.1 hypothetical protein BET10_20395 [Pseudoalteromonas amylolytica]